MSDDFASLPLSSGACWEATPELRWRRFLVEGWDQFYNRQLPQRVERELQQKWICRETRAEEWRDVPNADLGT